MQQRKSLVAGIGTRTFRSRPKTEAFASGVLRELARMRYKSNSKGSDMNNEIADRLESNFPAKPDGQPVVVDQALLKQAVAALREKNDA